MPAVSFCRPNSSSGRRRERSRRDRQARWSRSEPDKYAGGEADAADDAGRQHLRHGRRSLPGRGWAIGSRCRRARKRRIRKHLTSSNSCNGQIAGQTKLAPYNYRDFGSLVSLGHYSTVGSLMGFISGKSMRIEGLFLNSCTVLCTRCTRRSAWAGQGHTRYAISSAEPADRTTGEAALGGRTKQNYDAPSRHENHLAELWAAETRIRAHGRSRVTARDLGCHAQRTDVRRAVCRSRGSLHAGLWGRFFTALMATFHGSVHVLGSQAGRVVSHALWVTRWLQEAGSNAPMQTAFVEAVATRPDCQRQGLGRTCDVSVLSQKSAQEASSLPRSVRPMSIGTRVWAGRDGGGRYPCGPGLALWQLPARRS